MRGLLWCGACVALAMAACTVDPVDFTGKSCVDGPCPDGYSCEAVTHKCVAAGASDTGTSTGDAARPADAAWEDDASEDEADANGRADVGRADVGRADIGQFASDGGGPDVGSPDVGTPDSGTVGRPDTGGTDDAGTADTGTSPHDAGTPDTGSGGCTKDAECKTLGAYWCSFGTCKSCTDNMHCGDACTPCSPLTPACNPSVGCAMCATDKDCLSAALGKRCSPQGTCVQCLRSLDCDPGNYCDVSRSICVACVDNLHCGVQCQPCDPTLHCDGTACVSCKIDQDCPGQACCNSKCVDTVPPKLQRVNPPSAPVGSNGIALTLSGENFNACAQVLVDGKPVLATVASPTLITAMVPDVQLLTAGGLPVQVVNPGPNGGPSNPNAIAYASANLNAVTPIDVEYLDPDVLAVADYQGRQVVFYDANTLAGAPYPPVTTQERISSMRGSSNKLYLTIDKTAKLGIITKPLGGTVFTQLPLGNPGKLVDLDEAANIGVVVTNSADYYEFDIQSDLLGPQINFTPIGVAGLDGAAVDSRRSRILLTASAQTFIAPLGTAKLDFTTLTGAIGAAVDHSTGRAFAGALTSGICSGSTTRFLRGAQSSAPFFQA